MLLSPATLLKRGLHYVQIDASRKPEAKNNRLFHKHYGSSPLVVASMWNDMIAGDIPEARISKKEQCEKGLVMFLVACHFLWAYPKNAELISSRFGICENYSRGEHLWRWIKRIAALKNKVIKWDVQLNDLNSQILAISLDGVDFRSWEMKHPTLPRDNGQCSKKHNHGATKYLIVLSVFKPKVLALYGPYRGGEHDLTVLRKSELLERLAKGKKGIADRGYQTSIEKEREKLSLPSPYDSKELNNFKSRARLRQETFNGRLKFFKVMADTFEHGFDNHKFAFEAVAVIVQYQMDNGSPIYSV